MKTFDYSSSLQHLKDERFPFVLRPSIYITMKKATGENQIISELLTKSCIVNY